MKATRWIGQFLILAGVLVLFAFVVHRFVVPVILGFIISLVYRPVFLRLQKHLWNRTHLSAALSTLLVLLCVLLPLILLGIFVVKDATSLVKVMTEVSETKDAEMSTLMNIPALANLYVAANKVTYITQEEFAARTRAVFTEISNSGAKFLRNQAASVPRKIISIVFFLISFYFGLVDGPKFVGFWRANLPFSSKDISELFRHISRICSAVVLGALLAGIVQGTIIGLAYWIFGIPRAGLFAVLTAVFSFVPLVGCAPTSIGGILYLLANGRPAAAIGMGVAFLMAGLSDNVVKPWVLKGKTELHPLLGLLSVLGGLRIFGLAGLFLGPVITVLMIVLVQLVPKRITERAHQEFAETEAKPVG